MREAGAAESMTEAGVSMVLPWRLASLADLSRIEYAYVFQGPRADGQMSFQVR